MDCVTTVSDPKRPNEWETKPNRECTKGVLEEIVRGEGGRAGKGQKAWHDTAASGRVVRLDP